MSRVVGVDVGGTFTDLVYFDESGRTCRVAKVFSTPGNQADGVLAGLQTFDADLKAIDAIVHGTTVATNALLERNGARVGLITTRGFRDVLELQTRERPLLYGLKGICRPLVPRNRRLEVSERTDASGHVRVPVDGTELRAVAERLRDDGVECAVVSFLHSYANNQNEARARAILEEIFPSEAIVLSSEALPEIREFQRTSTAVISAYVQPLISRYLVTLQDRLRPNGYARDILVVQSNGGLMASAVAAQSGINTILSGPAAGVIAGSYIAAQAGSPNCITCDMGGTSFDVCLVNEGHPTMTTQTRLEFGLPVGVSMIDINTIGAGGGSIARLDPRGILTVGPDSAGAAPGPACYGLGGTDATVTDANLLIGRLNPGRSTGTEAGFELSCDRAAEAVGRLAAQLQLDPIATANAIIAVANSLMAASIRMVSVERGFDPRNFTLVAFGGAGPLHAASLMRELKIGRVLIPYYPGLSCALGCIIADMRHDFSRFVDRRIDELDTSDLEKAFLDHLAEGGALLTREGVDIQRVNVIREADMAYEGQLNSIRVRLPAELEDSSAIVGAFRRQYEVLYGKVLDHQPIRITNVRTSVIGERPKVDLRDLLLQPAGSLRQAQKAEREVYFNGRFRTTPVYERREIPYGTTFPGPAIVESADATVLVEPGCRALVDALGNLLLEDER